MQQTAYRMCMADASYIFTRCSIFHGQCCLIDQLTSNLEYETHYCLPINIQGCGSREVSCLGLETQFWKSWVLSCQSLCLCLEQLSLEWNGSVSWTTESWQQVWKYQINLIKVIHKTQYKSKECNVTDLQKIYFTQEDFTTINNQELQYVSKWFLQRYLPVI